MTTLGRRMLVLPLLVVLASGTIAPASAQDGMATSTISAIERGEAQGSVYLEGAILAQLAEERYLFSDGTGVIEITLAGDPDGDDPVAESAPPSEAAVPDFTLIGLEGTTDGDGVAVERWRMLRIVVPAVIVPEVEVIEAFRDWIVAYGGQAPPE